VVDKGKTKKQSGDSGKQGGDKNIPPLLEKRKKNSARFLGGKKETLHYKWLSRSDGGRQNIVLQRQKPTGTTNKIDANRTQHGADGGKKTGGGSTH